MKPYRSRAPKKRKLDGLETAIKMMVYPPVIVGALLFGGKKRRKTK